MKTNSKQVRIAVKNHILECTYDFNERNFKTFAEAKKHIISEFERVANYPYNLKMFPNKQDRFSDYLNGLPFHFHYCAGDIQDFLNGLGINPENKEYSCEKGTKLYHYLIFKEIFS